MNGRMASGILRLAVALTGFGASVAFRIEPMSWAAAGRRGTLVRA